LSQAFSTGAVESMITSPTTGKNKKIWENGVGYFYDIAAWFPEQMVQNLSNQFYLFFK
jgi:hypothetical protein